AALIPIAEGAQHAHDVAVAQNLATFNAMHPTAAPEKRSVDTAAVDDCPTHPVALERAVIRPRDEELGIRLERDVVDSGEAADRHAFARQLGSAELVAIRAGDDRIRSATGLSLGARFH